ncbi:BnaC02g45810D [Brassica napus]|uniref:(rape) hypothetical protein n=1 Tax=Brassica napus TaxID=3708 RepID=A0A078INU4_BRANA|nr:unnamed protein product [Brassica napus]CDY51607.1 BnaC02g45810D [Brassica napus]
MNKRPSWKSKPAITGVSDVSPEPRAGSSVKKNASKPEPKPADHRKEGAMLEEVQL